MRTNKAYKTYIYKLVIITRNDNNVVISRTEHYLFCDYYKALYEYNKLLEKFYCSTSNIKICLVDHYGVLRHYDTRKSRSK